MAELLGQHGPGWNTPTGHQRTGQWLTYGAGGMLRLLDPGTSDNEQLEGIQHRSYVPIWLAGLDDATLERPKSNDSIGLPAQPVSGGLSAPPGIFPPFMFSTRMSDGSDAPGQIEAVQPARTTRAIW